MQSSSVKSEMYPIWAVCLLTIFGCVDSITSSAISLDYKTMLTKMIYQLCLYSGYVLLMSISTISSKVGNIVIILLSVITFIKGFHRSLALVLPSKMRNMIRGIDPKVLTDQGALPDLKDPCARVQMKVDFPIDNERLQLTEWNGLVSVNAVHSVNDRFKSDLRSDLSACYVACLAFYLSHVMQPRLLFLDKWSSDIYTKQLAEGNFPWLSKDTELRLEVDDYKLLLHVTEVELAFLYDLYFSNNAFLQYYQEKVPSLWTLATFIGICSVVVAVAIPGTMTGRRTSPPGPGGCTCTVVLDTTTADVVITLSILVSLALLQLVQLIRSWTSVWAKVAFACEYTRKLEKNSSRPKSWWRWMRARALIVTRTNWFDSYLWQDKFGQYALVELNTRRECKVFSSCGNVSYSWACHLCNKFQNVGHALPKLGQMLGLPYFGQVLWEMWGSHANTQATIGLDPDVKASIAESICKLTRGSKKDWSSLFEDYGLRFHQLPWGNVNTEVDAYEFTENVMMWHIVTCFCELAEYTKEKHGALLKQTKGVEEENADRGETSAGGEAEKNRRVAITLSKYCAYLVVSAPELLPGPCNETRRAYDELTSEARTIAIDKLRTRMLDGHPLSEADLRRSWQGGVMWEEILDCLRGSSDPWKVLAPLWVQVLLYAAPHGDMEAHMQRLSQGGEFITHLWALLYHLGIRNWGDVAYYNQQKEDPTYKFLKPLPNI